MDLSKLLDTIRLSPKYLVPIFLASGFLLFGPMQYTATLGLDGFVASYRSWVGLIFLLSSVLLLSHLLISIGSWVKRKLNEQKSLITATNRLRNLTSDEKIVLRGYIFPQTKTQVLDLTDGIVNGLVHAEIIYQAAAVGSLREGFAYNIQSWAWDFLNKNKHLLDDSKGEKGVVHSSPFQRLRRR